MPTTTISKGADRQLVHHIRCAKESLWLVVPVVICLLGAQAGIAQTLLRGRVVNCGDTTGIPYANLYSRALMLGTVADSLGNFNLSLPADSLDDCAFTISSVGFASEEYTLGKAIQSSPAAPCLFPVPLDVPQVTVASKRFRDQKTYGNTSESSNIVSGWAVRARSGAERGALIRLKPGRDHLLKEIGIHIAHSTYDSLRLRFNLYSVPEGEIAREPSHSWLVQTDRDNGWIKAQVSQAVIARERIFLSVEIVETWSRRERDVLHLSAGLLTAGLYHRESRALPWQRAKAGLSLTVTTLRE
ncbi:hypothetical protein [Lewinella sp. IMCC34183]|uniref:hypothetical protein n=1 Tax=Lewinella sp. IMCC34183 TaxID=2248762 RepID=UPI000E28343E|nr:hypothetical protein [Lewinella sp. IMCC34183]